MSAKANLVDLAQYTATPDLKDAILDKIGNLDGFDIMGYNVLVALYVKPNKTKGGILLSDQTIGEDRFQGKCGLVLKKGPLAFKYQGQYAFEGPAPNIGDWIFMRAADGWDLDLKGIACRMVDSGQFQFTVLLDPIPAKTIKAVADSNDRLPRKSTFFYPKLPSGLVIFRTDGEI